MDSLLCELVLTSSEYCCWRAFMLTDTRGTAKGFVLCWVVAIVGVDCCSFCQKSLGVHTWTVGVVLPVSCQQFAERRNVVDLVSQMVASRFEVTGIRLMCGSRKSVFPYNTSQQSVEAVFLHSWTRAEWGAPPEQRWPPPSRSPQNQGLLPSTRKTDPQEAQRSCAVLPSSFVSIPRSCVFFFFF